MSRQIKDGGRKNGRRPDKDPTFFRPKRTGSSTASKRAQQLLPQPSLAAHVERLSDEGRGIARLTGDEAPKVPVFVAGALPGETVRVRLRERRRDFATAELLAVVTAAPERVAAPCPYFGRCGGCQLQMLATAEQLAHKDAVLRRLLGRFAVERWQPPLTADSWRYRHRARLALAWSSDGKVAIGFRAKESHAVVPVTTCLVLDERLQPLLEQLPVWLQALRQGRRVQEAFIVVDSAGKLGLDWLAEPPLAASDEKQLKAFAAAAGVQTGEMDLHYATGASVTGRSQANLAAQPAFAFRPRDFTQVNPAVNARLVAVACEWLAPGAGDHVVDFFSGLGNFSLALAASGARVTGLEADDGMVARARINAQRLGLGSVEFRQANLFDDPVLPARATLAVLDPPRAGARALCERLAKADLAGIVYVSCNPHTLVRDLAILTQGGYRIACAAQVDMFPQTGHIEAIVSLRR